MDNYYQCLLEVP